MESLLGSSEQRKSCLQIEAQQVQIIHLANSCILFYPVSIIQGWYLLTVLQATEDTCQMNGMEVGKNSLVEKLSWECLPDLLAMLADLQVELGLDFEIPGVF